MRNVADVLGISESYYCAIENGERQKRMDVSFALGLAKALTVDPAEILRNEAKYMQDQQECTFVGENTCEQ